MHSTLLVLKIRARDSLTTRKRHENRGDTSIMFECLDDATITEARFTVDILVTA